MTTTTNEDSAKTKNKESFIPNALLFNKNLSQQSISRKDPLKNKNLDYKNLELLKDYLTESNKIIGASITGVSQKKQRLLTKAIKRSQKLALLPCC
jgi:small subunit ribosomal protein S18